MYLLKHLAFKMNFDLTTRPAFQSCAASFPLTGNAINWFADFTVYRPKQN